MSVPKEYNITCKLNAIDVPYKEFINKMMKSDDICIDLNFSEERSVIVCFFNYIELNRLKKDLKNVYITMLEDTGFTALLYILADDKYYMIDEKYSIFQIKFEIDISIEDFLLNFNREDNNTIEIDEIFKNVVEPVVESVVEPVVESVVELVVEPAVEPVVEPVVESVVEPAVESVVESVVEPVVEPAVEPVVKIKRKYVKKVKIDR